jgi:hypothetical protein
MARRWRAFSRLQSTSESLAFRRGLFKRAYTIESRCFASVGAKTLNTNGIELGARIVTGVCDNQFAAVRKLLILKTERWPSG